MLPHYLKQAIQKVAIWAVWSLRLISRKRDLLVIQPGTAGSLGDQAMMNSVWQHLCNTQRRRMRTVLLHGFELIPNNFKNDHSIQLVSNSTASKLSFIWSLRTAYAVTALGADVIDGVYNEAQSISTIELLEIANSVGAKSRVFGFSFSETPNQNVIEKIRRASRGISFCARDRISLKRFEVATDQRAILVADLAFLLKPEITSESGVRAQTWLRESQVAGRNLIALNVNAQTANGVDVDQIVATYVEAIETLANASEGRRFVLIPHDFRGKYSDWELNKRVFSKLTQATKEKSCCINPPFNCWDAKAIVSQCDLVITGRMHLAIAAFGVGTPVIGISYVGKFEGLFELFDQTNYVLTPAQAYLERQIATAAEDSLLSTSETRELIKARFETVETASMQNFLL